MYVCLWHNFKYEYYVLISINNEFIVSFLSIYFLTFLTDFYIFFIDETISVVCHKLTIEVSTTNRLSGIKGFVYVKLRQTCGKKYFLKYTHIILSFSVSVFLLYKRI